MRTWIITLKNKAFLHSTAVLIGTMVGVGIFGIPLAFAKAGFLVGLGFMVFAAMVTGLFTLLFAEVVLRTEGRHQLVGYTGIYLGPFYKKIIFLANTIGIYGALLAYIIVTGNFLNNILSHYIAATPETYSIVFAVLASLVVYTGLRTGVVVEFGLTLLFMTVMAMIFGVGIGKIDMANFSGFNAMYWFLPYGVLLFAFGGLSSVPLQREILRGQEKLLKPSILTAVVVVSIMYLLFAVTVVGISGAGTTDDAISGLLGVLGPQIIFLGSLFGVLAISTSFLMGGLALQDIFLLDYKLPRVSAWLLTVVPPLVMFWGGMRNFVDIIGLVGSVAIGIESIIFVFLLRKSRHHGQREPEFHLKVPQWILYLFIPIFLAGVIYDLIH